MSDRPAIGIDLGGTKIHAGIVLPGGRVLGEARVPTEADRDCEAVLSNIVDAAHRAAREAGIRVDDVAAVGIGSPAPLDMQKGILLTPANLPSLHDFPIVARLAEALGKPVRLDNDANCFGLGEARFGAGAGARVCCGLTLGTGLGAFLVLDGRVYDGPHGAGVEIWCSPYMGDHVEQKTNGAAVARNYLKLTDKMATPEEVTAMAEAGRPDALEAYREYGRDVGVPVAYLCNILDPDVVVLGGSVTKAWKFFHEALTAMALKYINVVNRRHVRIVRGALGGSAGMLGAAALVHEEPPGA